jgi:isoleucyl-tRNA synthetase
MAPFTPFLTETIYQNLRPLMPASSEDTRSVHFLHFPEVKAQYFDEDIERAVSRMQSVIELGRAIRDRRTLPLKTPLREYIVINADKQYQTDIRALENYIVDELNIHSLTLSDDEAKYGVKYRITPDNRVIGQKYKKDAQKIFKALKGMCWK